MKLAAGPWLPDQPPLGNPGLVRAENVIPAAGHYRAFPAAASLGVSGLSGQSEGITVALPTTGEPVLFVGSGAALWRIPGITTSPVDVSGAAYTMLPGSRWRFVQYGALLLAVNLHDNPQKFDLTNLAGTFADLTDAPKAKYVTRVRDFVMLGHVDESPDGEVPYRLRWHGFDPTSGLPDPEEWTISLETRSDFQDVADVGGMTGLTGGDFGIALFRKGIARVDFGGQYLFTAPVVDTNIGCKVPGSVVRYGVETYFWSDEGVFKTAGGPAVPVGTERVNRYLLDSLSDTRHDDVWAYPDYQRGIIVWLLPTNTDTSRLLIYRPTVDQFSTVEVDLDSLGPVVSFGLDLDDPLAFPDLDTDPRNLDDPQLWTSGILGLGGQVDGGDLRIFNGQPLPGLLEWSEMEPGDGARYALNRGLVYHERGSAQIVVRSRERVGDDLITRGPFSAQSDGYYRFSSNGRFHRIRVLMNDDWETVRGADVRGGRLGMR